MIEENLLDAVIGLPGNLFPTTNIPVAILIFDRSRENKPRMDANGLELIDEVLFIDAGKDFLPSKNQNILRDEDIEKIVDTYKCRKVIDKYSYLASFDEIKENDFNLNIPRYVDTFEEEEDIDIDAIQKEIDRLDKELVEVREKMAEKLKSIER
ncbi:hypothetical protein ES705_28269 [subsurface metagenome]